LILLLIVVLLAAWWMRRGAASSAERDTPPPPAGPVPPEREAMARCPHCGLHVPQSQSWPGRGGAFCSAEHRAAHESDAA
jgi:uncharacterized protein